MGLPKQNRFDFSEPRAARRARDAKVRSAHETARMQAVVNSERPPVTTRPPRLPPILWQPQTLWTAMLQVYGVDKRRYVAITPLDDGRWNVTGFEAPVTDVETEEGAILATLKTHAHEFLGIFEDFKLAKKAGDDFLHELCQAAGCEHLDSCECSEVAPKAKKSRKKAPT